MINKITTPIENLNSKIDNIVLEYFSTIVNNPHSDGKLNLKKIISDFNSMYVNIENLSDSIDNTSTISEISLKKKLAQLGEDLGTKFNVSYTHNTPGLCDELSTYILNKRYMCSDQISLIKENIRKDVFHIYSPAEKSYTKYIFRVSLKELTIETLDKTSKDYRVCYFSNPWALINTVLNTLESGYKIHNIHVTYNN